ncbi:MAG TPA: hypothetical protein VK731_11955 [Candidatus Cybelea sp.]|nr:hypothetical protein [Candidatus Cybelea sp.]
MKLTILLLLGATSALVAGPTNPILFVTQVPIPADFCTIGSTFGNQRTTVDACGRGGDLYILYPDGTLKNLTRAAGYGQWGGQYPNGIAVRQPCVHWSGQKAVFSMVVGGVASSNSYSAPTVYWQLYEITNFTDPNATPVITKVPNQPTNFNNLAPIYGSADQIIFTSDRPRTDETQLYPQLDEYEEQPTVTGLWSLDPASGNLFMINHTPSGAFTPLIDSAGRIVFVRWDHLQRDQQADTDFLEGADTYGTFNWSDESSNSVITPSNAEIFPEPRPVRTDLLAGTGLAGNTFNQFFPWAINQDGTDEETVNHVGRHELGGSYLNAAYTNDPNIVAQDVPIGANKNTISDFLQIREDPNTPGLFYGIDAPEFTTHSGGQLISLTGATNINAFYMQINYLTPRSTQGSYVQNGVVPADDTGFYRNPLMTTDGYMIAAHTTNVFPEVDDPDPTHPSTAYDFRLKFLTFTNGYYVPGATLTPGLTNAATYWDPNLYTNVYQTQLLWELDPVEVRPRTPPAPYSVPIPAPELAAFAAANVDVAGFQRYLATHELALIVSRDVTTRDSSDHQQPYNLQIAGTAHETISKPGKIYDIAWLQLFQADQLRSFHYGDTNDPGYGRRVLAQYLHDPAVDNPSNSFTPIGSVRLGPDGSSAAIVPARRAMSWQLIDTNGVGVVRERYWLTFAPGEIRSCTSCHGINETNQADQVTPTNMPLALVQLLGYWKTNATIQGSIVTNQGAPSFQISFIRRPAETGVTYHVQASADLMAWADIATYAGTNVVLGSGAAEISRNGSPNETVTVGEAAGTAGQRAQFLRVNVTRP